MEIANLKVYNDNMRKSLLDKAETVKYTGVLDQSQLEHVIIFIQDGRSSSDIKDLIEHYENENAKVDDLIGDPIFIEG